MFLSLLNTLKRGFIGTTLVMSLGLIPVLQLPKGAFPNPGSEVQPMSANGGGQLGQ